MEEAKPYTSAAKQLHNILTRNIPGSQNDADFVMEHLNDPNFDLSQLPSSVVIEESTQRYVSEDGSSGIRFDKSTLSHPFILISNNVL